MEENKNELFNKYYSRLKEHKIMIVNEKKNEWHNLWFEYFNNKLYLYAFIIIMVFE